MTVIRIVAFVIFIISSITIYHNSNSFEPKKRIIFIAIGMIIMYIITSIICWSKTSGIEYKHVLDDIVSVVKMIFTPVNAMIALSLLGNTMGKAKDKVISTDKAGKRIIGIIIIFILVLIYESNYIANFITEILAQAG